MVDQFFNVLSVAEPYMWAFCGILYSLLFVIVVKYVAEEMAFIPERMRRDAWRQRMIASKWRCIGNNPRHLR